MIKAAHHPVFEKFLGAYLRIHMRLIFRHVKIHSTLKDNGKPVLLIGNHFSWWDGFIARHVNINIFKRQLHLMMEEEQLAKRRFLSRLGAFSIKKNSRSAVESLNYAASVLNDPGKLLVVFPQGRFQSLHQHPLTFEKGWFRIIQKAQPDIQIVFMAALTDYFSSPRPGLDIYLERATPDNQYIPSAESNPDHHIAPLPVQDIHKNHLLSDAKTIETAFNAFHKKAIGLQNIGI